MALEEYYSAIRGTSEAGPINFEKILKEMGAYIEKFTRQNTYHIFTIISNSNTNDVQATQKALMNLSHLPVSIIIIGVGNGDFRKIDNIVNSEKIAK